MKALVITLTLTVFFLTLIFIFYLRLTLPVIWPIKSGSITVSKVVIDEASYLKVTGDSMNYIGQFQCIDIQMDYITKKIRINRFIIRNNPFSKISCNNQWPVFFPINDLEQGRYEVVYLSDVKCEEMVGWVKVEKNSIELEKNQ